MTLAVGDPQLVQGLCHRTSGVERVGAKVKRETIVAFGPCTPPQHSRALQQANVTAGLRQVAGSPKP